MNAIISEIVRIIDTEEADVNPLNYCEIVDYEFKEHRIQFSKRYKKHQLQQLCNFVDSLKYVRTKQSHKATIIPLATTGKLLKGLFQNEMNASNFLKKAIEIGLLEVYNSKYQFNAYKSELNKSRTYAYNYKVEKTLKELFKEYNIVPSIQKNATSQKDTTKVDISKYQKYDVKIGSNFRILIKDKREFESFALNELHKKYPELQYFQRLVDEINTTYYKDYSELQMRLEPKFTYSNSGYLTKIGIRLTSSACGSKKGKRGKFFGILRSQIRDTFGIKEFNNSDVRSSIPRITKSLNESKWVNEDIDLYESILTECKSLVYSKSCKTSREVEMYEDFKLWLTGDTREDIKTTHMRSYFCKSPEEMNAKIMYKGRKQNLQNTDYIREICKINYEAVRNVEGASFRSEAFLWESCIYLLALKKVLDSGNFCVLFYDSFESSKWFDRRKIVEDSFYEFLKIRGQLVTKVVSTKVVSTKVDTMENLNISKQKSSSLRSDDLYSNVSKTIAFSNVFSTPTEPTEPTRSIHSSDFKFNSIKSNLTSNISPISKSKSNLDIQISKNQGKFENFTNVNEKKLIENPLKYTKRITNGIRSGILQNSS